jgi:hypothetical protein
MKKNKWVILSIVLAISVAMSVGIQACGSADSSSTNTVIYGAAS